MQIGSKVSGQIHQSAPAETEDCHRVESHYVWQYIDSGYQNSVLRDIQIFLPTERLTREREVDEVDCHALDCASLHSWDC